MRQLPLQTLNFIGWFILPRKESTNKNMNRTMYKWYYHISLLNYWKFRRPSYGTIGSPYLTVEPPTSFNYGILENIVQPTQLDTSGHPLSAHVSHAVAWNFGPLPEDFEAHLQ